MIKRRVHFRITTEALARLDDLVKIANSALRKRCGPGVINRSDILENIIIKHTRNKTEIIDERLKELAKEINHLQDIRADLLEKAERDRIIEKK